MDLYEKTRPVDAVRTTDKQIGKMIAEAEHTVVCNIRSGLAQDDAWLRCGDTLIMCLGHLGADGEICLTTEWYTVLRRSDPTEVQDENQS